MNNRVITVGFLGILLLSTVITPLASFILPVYAPPVTVLTFKWSRSGLGSNWEGGLVIGDVTGDGREDIVYGGNDLLSVLDGSTGATIATYAQTRIGQYCQPQLYDVDGDGILDILVPLYYLPGLAAVQYDGDSTLRVMWIANIQGSSGSGSVMAKPVAGDIDGDGDLDIFIASQDVSPLRGYDGTICRLDHLGNIVAQSFTWRACSGGLSLADTDNDGVFELYQGDRQMSYRDGGYGKGVRSFWAENLTERWNRLDFLSSSQSPVLADVNKDGVLDVLAGMYHEMNVLNSTNGEWIYRWQHNAMSVHYGFVVYDIDADGNLELLCSDGDHDNDPYVDIFDLTTGQLDAELYLGHYSSTQPYDEKWGPLVADIYDNGNNPDGTPRMEIITGANTTRVSSTGSRTYPAVLLVYDNQYNLLQNITGLSNQIGYPFTQDVDGDGLLEVVVNQNNGVIRVYDTMKTAPSGSQRIRSDVTYFGEKRLGVAEHTIMPWEANYWTVPLVRPSAPADNSLAVPVSINQLSFQVRDHQGESISWSVTTSPNIGSASGTISSGTYSWNTRTVSINGLTPDTTYRWTVTATAGGQTTRRTYTFRTEQASKPGNVAPSQETPTLTPLDGVGTTTSTFKVMPQSTTDPNGDPVTNIYRWTVNGEPVAKLLLPFDTRDETVAKDYSGYGNDGQVIGATWVPNGIVGGAYSFDGKDDAIKISDGGLGYFNDRNYTDNKEELGGFGNWDSVTVEAWIYLTENNYGSRFVGKINSYALGFQSSLTNPNRLTAAVWPYTGEIAEDDNRATVDRMRSVNYNTPLQLNTWYHVAFTYESGVGIKLYLNGLLVASSSTYTGPLSRSRGEPVWIGRLVEPFAGMIDDVRLYNYALPAEQIYNRYMESKDGTSSYSLYIPMGFAAPGDDLSCDVTPTDSWAEGATRSTPVYDLLNAPPVASNLNISPIRDRPYRLDNEDLGAVYDYSDPDGQLESDSQIRWYMNGVLQPAFNNLKTIPASSTSVGQTWYFTVEPKDSGGAVGALQTSETITIRGNSAPGTGVPTLDSMNGGTDYDDEDLVGTAVGTADGDSDPTTNIYRWTRNGVSMTNLQLPFDTEVPRIPGASGVTLDYSGYNNNGVVNGSTWIQDGVIGGAFSFDGNDYIRVQENGNTLGGDGSWSEISVEFWIKATGDTGTETVLLKHDELYSMGGYGGSSYGVGYRIDYRSYTTGYMVYWYIYNSTASVSLNSQVNEGAGQWHHIVATYQSGVGLKLYTDGLLRATLAATGNINATLDGLLDIGGLGSASGDFIGQIDEVRIYPKALSAAQVFQRYMDTKDGDSDSETIVAEETSSGDSWICKVTPNDSWVDGTTKTSSTLTVVSVSGNRRPRIDWFSPADTTPDVDEGASLNFMQVSSDPDGDPLSFLWTLDSVKQATTQNWTYTPDFLSQGLHAVSVTVSDGSLIDSQEWTVNVVDVPTEFRKLEILSSAHGTTDPIPSVYDYGKDAQASVLAIPDAGYKLDYWELDGVSSGNANPYLLTMDNDHTLQPWFVEVTDLTLTVNVNPIGGGTVSKNPDKPTYSYGEEVTLTVSPAEGYKFAGWSGDASGADPNITITMTSDKIITATFLPTYNLIISVNGAGTTDPEPGIYSYSQGTVVQLTAYPDSGYIFTGWSGSLTGNANPATITMDSNKTVTANFAEEPSIFYTGYEPGDPSWSSITTSGGTFTVSSDIRHHGSYSGRYATSGSTGTQNAYTTVNVNEGDVYVRGYFYIDSGLPLANSGDRFYFMRFRSATGLTLASVGIRNNGGVNQWIVIYRSESTLYGPIYLTSLGTPSMDAWYSLELHRRTAASGVNVELWMDGVLVYQSPSINTNTAGNVAYIDVGAVYATSVQGGLTVYSDCVEVSDSMIGPEDVTTYTLTTQVSGSGSVSRDPDKITYPEGTSVKLTAIANSGYVFDHWEGDLTGNTNPVTIIMDSDKTVTAVFVENPVTTIFEDGFESGSFSQWTGLSVTSGETATVVSGMPHDGSYSARFTTNGGGGTERAYVYRNIDSQTEVYVRGYFYIDSGLPLDVANDRFNLYAFMSGSTTLASMGVRRTSTSTVWYINSNVGYWTATSGPSMDGWYSVEFYIRVDSTNGILRAWVNGNLVLERTGINTAQASGVTSVRSGLVYVYNVLHPVDVYADSFVISNSYIGP
ncbi:MAG: InlB B-repeat-containing protein [Candidatus Bathyarchaeia archaeon]